MFQSTPAIAGGRLQATGRDRSDIARVSIHARHCWRATPGWDESLLKLELVSIHARHCWRATRQRRRGNPQHGRFNPRPPLLAGDSWCTPASTAGPTLFQSTPAIAGGRLVMTLEEIYARCTVSIHARHCWRATHQAALAPQHHPVSIHARHCWRATHKRHNRPARRWMFQSTPAIAGGRLIDGPDGVTIVDFVSIHARHCWRATLTSPLPAGANSLVSIHARHCWRATHSRRFW